MPDRNVNFGGRAGEDSGISSDSRRVVDESYDHGSNRIPGRRPPIMHASTVVALVLAPVLLAPVTAQRDVTRQGPPHAADLEAPILIRSGGEPIDVTTGHAAPYVMDFDGDGVFDLLVGEFGTGTFPADRLPNIDRVRRLEVAEGKLRVYRNVGTNTAPRFDGFTYLQAGGEDASIPTT